MAKKSKLAERLGFRIRDLRRGKKITLIDLSKMTRIAQATLSRMETGLMLGTVTSHQKIAEALGISLSQLYEGIDNRLAKTCLQEATGGRKTNAKSDRMKCELLTQEISKKKMTPLLFTLNQNGKTEFEQLEHGVEKFLFVLEGEITASVGEDDYFLKPNDTLYFEASLPHQLRNLGAKPAKVFCAVSPARL